MYSQIFAPAHLGAEVFASTAEIWFYILHLALKDNLLVDTIVADLHEVLSVDTILTELLNKQQCLLYLPVGVGPAENAPGD